MNYMIDMLLANFQRCNSRSAFSVHVSPSSVRLTVFKNNAGANNFFREKLKYELDETSPQESLAEQIHDDYSYVILSKAVKRKNDTVATN